MSPEELAEYKSRLDHIVTSAQRRVGVMPAAERPTAEPFRSQQEVVSAMRDARYRSDPAYRREIAGRMAASGRLMGGR